VSRQASVPAVNARAGLRITTPPSIRAAFLAPPEPGIALARESDAPPPPASDSRQASVPVTNAHAGRRTATPSSIRAAFLAVREPRIALDRGSVAPPPHGGE